MYILLHDKAHTLPNTLLLQTPDQKIPVYDLSQSSLQVSYQNNISLISDTPHFPSSSQQYQTISRSHDTINQTIQKNILCHLPLPLSKQPTTLVPELQAS